MRTVLSTLGPHRSLLDVGCGCGHFTQTLCAHCERIVAVDANPSLIARWCESGAGSAIRYGCMDGRSLAFADGSFPVVVERASLHHIDDWRRAVAEMARVSAGHIIVEEPIDDLRSPAKRRTYEAQGLLLELQHEVAFPHYRHVALDDIVSCVEDLADAVSVSVTPRDDAVPFDEYFRTYDAFASRSGRQDYWRDRLAAFRDRIDGESLCEDDWLTVLAEKRIRARRG